MFTNRRTQKGLEKRKLRLIVRRDIVPSEHASPALRQSELADAGSAVDRLIPDPTCNADSLKLTLALNDRFNLYVVN